MKKLKQFRHVVAQMCVLLGQTDCGNRNDTSPRANQKQLYCRSFYHKRTSAMAARGGEVASGGQAVPPTQQYWWQISHSFKKFTTSIGRYPTSWHRWACLNPSVPTWPQSRQIRSRARRVYMAFSTSDRSLHTLEGTKT